MTDELAVPIDREREGDVVTTMARLADSLVTDFDPVELLRDLSESCLRLLDADAAGVSVGDRGHLRFVVATSERMELMELFQSDYDEGPCLDAFRAGTHVEAPDLEQAGRRWPNWTPRAVALGFQAADAFPLRLRDESIGALNVYSNRRRRLDPDDAVVGQALANTATITLLQQRLTADHERVHDQLQHALDSRVVIEQAKGIVSERMGVSVDEAFEKMRHRSRTTNTRIAEIARGVVEGATDLSGG